MCKLAALFEKFHKFLTLDYAIVYIFLVVHKPVFILHQNVCIDINT